MIPCNDLSDEANQNFNSLRDEHTILLEKALIYSAFLGGENVLMEASALVYAILMDCIMDDLIITISRLTDESKQGRNENSTIFRLQEDLKEVILKRKSAQSESDSESITEFNAKIDRLKTHIQSLRVMRNKRLAHRDLATLCQEFQSKEKQNVDASNNVVQSIQIIGDILSLFASIVCHVYLYPDVLLPPNVPLNHRENFIENLNEGNKWRASETKKYLAKYGIE